MSLVGVGSCTINANQAGNADYAAATPVSQTFTVTANPVTIALSSPIANQQLQAPVNLTLTATVADSVGTITQVAFYNAGALMGTVTQSPYKIEIPNAAVGSYQITATATDNNGDTATSAAVSVTVAANSGAEQIYYINADQLNTPRLLTNSDGQVVWQWDGEAFGNTPPNSNPSGLGNVTFNLRFPGQYYDAETNLHYNYFRDYDPATGRYIESDPLGFGGGQTSTFGYAGANSLSGSDRFGLWDRLAHNRIFELALGPCGVSDGDIAAMEAESDLFDRQTGLGISGSNLHSMLMPFQSQASALQNRDFFVDQQIILGQILYGDGNSDANLHFAQAAHTMQDATSPAHVDSNGNLKTWYILNGLVHGSNVFTEEDLNSLMSPENSGRLADAIMNTRNLWMKMTGNKCACQK